MNKKEILEIKRRYSKKHVSFSRLTGCYVDLNREKLCQFNRQFLSLEEDEFYKYLEIAGKVLSGTLGNNLLNLDFPLSEEREGGSQDLLMKLRASRLEDEELLEKWYDRIIASYHHPGNYLILMYMDSYDIPLKTSDGLRTGESEEVYTHFLCAVCPVELSDPGLGYQMEEKRFGARIQDWIVKAPETGFLFPAFNDRSTDIHQALFYTKDTKEPHDEFMGEILGCEPVSTATEQRVDFAFTVKDILGEEEEEAQDQYLDLQQNLRDLKTLAEEEAKAMGEDVKAEPMLLTRETVQKALADTKIPAEKAEKIEAKVAALFEEAAPPVEHILDTRALKNNEIRVERNRLRDELVEMNKTVKELKAEREGFDVMLTLSEEKTPYIRYEIIEGERYMLVPVDSFETVSINGEEQ